MSDMSYASSQWWLNPPSVQTQLNVGTGFNAPTQTVLSMSAPQPKPTFMEKYGAQLAMSGIALQGFAQALAGTAQVENIFANIERTEDRISQIERQTRDALSRQVRKNKKRTGQTRAKIGASGVDFSGSALMVQAHNHQVGIRDYDAIYQQGEYAVSAAYDQIYDMLDQAEDAGRAMMVGGVSTLASSAFAYGAMK